MTSTNDNIKYSEYESEVQLPDIMQLIENDLSEPYSVYTYRYFIHNWPNLCFLASDGDKYVGVIICKLDRHRDRLRGYIAMLAVAKSHRKMSIGSSLVKMAIHAMKDMNADEVVLETEFTNFGALGLYERLGFIKDKRLFRYYLNGVDAFRLKLFCKTMIKGAQTV
ncbi:putative acyltransfersase [Parasitella parasitica]|nr:putative acyltransfersase [Parasitella parasitica]